MSVTATATITSKGQVTIPKEIRDRLELEAGEEIEFILGERGRMEVRPTKPAMERLAAVRDAIATRADRIDVDEIRRESKRAWDTVPDDGP